MIAPMPEHTRALLFLNGIGLFLFALFVGWQWFVALLGELVAWPLLITVHVTMILVAIGLARALRSLPRS